MKLLRGLLLTPTLNLLNWIILKSHANSLIGGGPLGWSWYATLAAMATDHHGDMTAFGGTHHAHSQLGGVTADQHHTRLHPTEHQDGGIQEISIAGLSGEPAELTTHKGLESAHHTKFTITEHDVVARHPLSVLDPAVCSETEADNKIAARVPSGLIVLWHGTIHEWRRLAGGRTGVQKTPDGSYYNNSPSWKTNMAAGGAPTGGGGAHENEPSFYDVAFLMKT